MQQPITLSDDPRERVDQILLAIGTISIDLSGFDAVYLISGIQTLMTLPGFIDRTSIAGLRLQQFAERLQPHVYREPLIKQLIDDGWTAVEIARQAYEEIKLEAKTTLPKDLSGLKKVAKAAKLKNFSSMKKPALIEALKALPSDTLIAAIEQAS
jgi:hypothetical protein